MTVSPEIQQILDAHSELELSEWSADPLPDPPGGDDVHVHAPAPAPAGGHDQDAHRVVQEDVVGPVPGPVCQEVFQQAIAPPVTAKTPAPRRWRGKAAVPEASGSGNGTQTPTLDEMLLFTATVARLIHVHPQSVRRYVARGDLVGIKVGGRLLIPALAVEEFLKARKVPVRSWALRRKGSPHGQA